MKHARLLVFASAAAGSCAAQSPEWTEGWETVWGGDYALVAAPGWDEGDGADPETALYELGVRFEASRVLDNGAEIGLRSALRAQRDHPGRAGFSGCVPGAGEPGQGAATGLAACAAQDAGPRGSLERAYIYVDGGYGELSLGRDLGAAARAHEGPSEVFSHARTLDPLLDPGGLNILRLRADLAGPAEKIAYASPRILGLRAGASYTPRADVRGLDRDPARRFGGAASPRLQDVWEAGLNLSRRLPDSGVRIRAGAGFATASVDGDPAVFQDEVSVWSAGAEVDVGAVSLSAGALGSDNGLRGSGDVSAWSLGVRGAAGFGLDWSAVYGRSEDDGLAATGESWGVGVGRDLADGLLVAAGYQAQTLESGGAAAETSGLVFEITQSF